MKELFPQTGIKTVPINKPLLASCRHHFFRWYIQQKRMVHFLYTWSVLCKEAFPKQLSVPQKKVRNPKYYPTDSSHFCILLHFRCGTNKASPKLSLKQVNPADLHLQPQGVKVNKISCLSRSPTPSCITKVNFKCTLLCVSVQTSLANSSLAAY